MELVLRKSDLAQGQEVLGITIDGPLSRDLDDAIWMEPGEDPVRLRVCIADVASTVKVGSNLDERALAAGFTRYFSVGNAPMLPRRFSEDELSLLPNRPRNVICLELTLDSDMELSGIEVSAAQLRSKARLSHAEAAEILHGPESPLQPLLMIQRWTSILFAIIFVANSQFFAWYIGMLFPLALLTDRKSILADTVVLLSGTHMLSFTFLRRKAIGYFVVATLVPIVCLLIASSRKKTPASALTPAL